MSGKLKKKKDNECIMNPIIELKEITYKYQEDSEQLALDRLSLTIQPGEWVAIIGRNGSGKSTLAKTMNGLLEPLSGEVWVDNEKLTLENLWDVRSKIGMVFQNPDNQFVGATVEDDVAFGMENQGIPREEMQKRVQRSLESVRMIDFKDREPARLSGGQKQRVAIAGVIALQPKVIILDEATSMLDPEGRHEVISTIQKLKETEQLTVISITHDIDEASRADRIIVMKDGIKVTEGTPAEIFSLGQELITLGLDLPFPEKVKSALREQGVQIPQEYMSEERLIEWLWTSSLNK